MKKRMDLKVKMALDVLGATCALVGLSGIAGASEGEGRFVVALVVFLFGITEVAWSYQR